MRQGIRKPNAYDIFGLAGPISDDAEVAAAIRKTIASLRSSKSTADASQWRIAAKAVKHAKSILTDKELKSQLDRAIATSNVNEPVVGQEADENDPLAGILPKIDPLASILPKIDPSPNNKKSPSLCPSPPVEQPKISGENGSLPVGQNEVDELIVEPIVEPIEDATDEVSSGDGVPVHGVVSKPILVDTNAPVALSQTRRKKRKSSATTIVITICILGLIVAACVLGYLNFYKPSRRLQASPNRDAKTKLAANQNARIENDGVLKSPPPATKSIKSLDDVAGTANTSNAQSTSASIASDSPAPGRPPKAPQRVARERVAAEPVAPEPFAAKSEPNTQPANPLLTTPQSRAAQNERRAAEDKLAIKAAAEARLQQAAEVIRNRQWRTMPQVIQGLRENPMPEQTSEKMEALYLIANMATFFRGGIEQGISIQNVGSQFEVVPGMMVGVVSTEEDQHGITLNIAARPREFHIDSMPFSLADRLAAFRITQQDGYEIARAIYHCLAPQTTKEIIAVEMNYLRTDAPPTKEISGPAIADAMQMILLNQ